MNDQETNQNAPDVPSALDLHIEKLVTGGAGLGRHDGQAVFVPLTAPGDHVRAQVVERRKGFVRAQLTEVLEPGPGRQEPPCPHFGVCGGCDLQHLDQTTQRQIKADIVRDCFHRLGKLDVTDIIFGPENGPSTGYRTRIRVFASATGPYGMMRRGTHEVVPLSRCDLMPALFNDIILPWLRFLPPVEQVIVRLDGRGHWLLSVFGPPQRLKVMRKIIGAVPDGEAPATGCVGVLFNNLPVWGHDHLLYEVAGHKYRVSAQSFFQGNLTGTEEAVSTVRDWITEIQAAGRLGDFFADLYCGVGLFSLALSDLFQQVLAVDTDKNSCRDAANNIQRDQAAGGRVTLQQGPVSRILTETKLATEAQWSTSLCLLDPPRAGLGKTCVKALVDRNPRHIIAMSCDPATLARDTAALVQAGYIPRKLKVMDFFPQTAHIECLLLLEKQP